MPCGLSALISCGKNARESSGKKLVLKSSIEGNRLVRGMTFDTKIRGQGGKKKEWRGGKEKKFLKRQRGEGESVPHKSQHVRGTPGAGGQPGERRESGLG